MWLVLIVLCLVLNIDCLMQDCCISSALALEILQSCIEPSIYHYHQCISAISSTISFIVAIMWPPQSRRSNPKALGILLFVYSLLCLNMFTDTCNPVTKITLPAKTWNIQYDHQLDKPLACVDRFNSVQHSKYHGCWCPGSLRRQDISVYGIDYIE